MAIGNGGSSLPGYAAGQACNASFRVSRHHCGITRMRFGSSRIPLAVLVLGYVFLSAGCAEEHISSGTGYAVVPAQIVAVAGVSYEILDRPDVGRVTITPLSVPRDKWAALTGQVSKLMSWEPDHPNRSNGSAYFEPLMQYFALSGRTCRLFRGNPLMHPQWEFAYTCRPGYDPSAITWHSSGYSNAPSYPNR
jgi:hypothetical protein